MERFGTDFCMAHPYSAVNQIWPNGLSKICNDPNHVALVETVISTVYTQAVTQAMNRIGSLGQESILEDREIRKIFPDGIQIEEMNLFLNDLDEALDKTKGDPEVTDSEYHHTIYNAYHDALGKNLAKLTPAVVAKAVGVETHRSVNLMNRSSVTTQHCFKTTTKVMNLRSH